MSASKRVKFPDHPDTLDFDELDIEPDILPPAEQLKDELDRIKACFTGKGPVETRMKLWDSQFPEAEPIVDERDTILLSAPKPLRTNKMPLPVPMDNSFVSWLIHSPRDAVLNKPSLFAINYGASSSYRTLCSKLDAFINVSLPNDKFTNFIESFNFNDHPTQRICAAGVALEYCSKNTRLVIMTDKNKIIHYWIFTLSEK